MSYLVPYMMPATIVSYNNVERTAQVAIAGLTDGADEGITAMLAYPIGDDDRDTERELIAGADVWVFFEQGLTSAPVIAFYRRHGQGLAVVDVRRLRQKNIEILARSNITLSASELVSIKARQITIEAEEINIRANINQVGDYFIAGNQTISGGQTINGNSVSYGNQTINGSLVASSVTGGGISLSYHGHSGVKTGSGISGNPIKL